MFEAEFWVAVAFVIFEEDGIDHRVGPLGGLNGILESLLAAPVHAIGEQDQRFPARLVLHDFVSGEENAVIEQCAGAAPVSTLSSAMPRSRV